MSTGPDTLPPPVAIGNNPYVGPRPLRGGERLYGRTRELNDLRHSVVADRVVLLCSPSGAGKSSLLEAGLRPALEAEGLRVLPTIRVSHELDGLVPANRYTASVLLSLEQAAGRASMSTEALSSMTLAEYGLQPLLSGDDEVCLFFDQFEEVFTLDPIDVDAKAAFFRQLGTLLHHPGLWAVFAMRDDYIAQLEPYLDAFPRRLATRKRLDFLDVRAATEAVVAPAREQGLTFDEAAVRRLIDDLRLTKVMRGGREDELPGPYVEPVQLQVVCRQLYSRLPAGTTVVTEGDVRRYADPTNALAAFYAEQVGDTAAHTGVPERFIREWFQQQLITPQGFRAQTNSFPHERGQDVLDRLENAYLVRSESGRGQKWYELTHDRMVGPVLDDNRTWFAGRLNQVQRLAAEWSANNEPDGMLVTGEVLLAAEVWLRDATDALPGERTFVERSREHERAARRELAQARRRSVVFGVLAIAAVASLVATALLWVRSAAKDREAESARRTSASLDLAARSRAATDPYQAALLAIEADAAAGDATPSGVGAWTAAAARYVSGMSWRRRPPVLLRAGAVNDVAWNGSGDLLAAACSDGVLRFVDPSEGTVRVSADLGVVTPYQVWWRPSGDEVAVLGDDGAVWRVRAADGAIIGEPVVSDQGQVVTFEWMPNGSALVLVTGDGTVDIVDVSTRARVAQLASADGGYASVRMSPDGDQVAVVTAEGGLQLVPVRRQREFGEPEAVALDAPVSSIGWTAGGDRLTVVLDTGDVVELDASGRPLGRLPAPGGVRLALIMDDPASGGVVGATDNDEIGVVADGVYRTLAKGGLESALVSFATSASGTLAIGGGDGSIRFVDTRSGERTREPVYVAGGAAYAPSFQPATTNVLAYGGDGAVYLFDAATGAPIRRLAGSVDANLWTVVWSHDGSRLAMAVTASDSDEARLGVWEIASGQEVTASYLRAGVTVAPTAVTWGAGRSLLVAADGALTVLDGAGGSRQLSVDGTGVTGLAWSPDGARLAVARASGVDVYDVGTGRYAGRTDVVTDAEHLWWNADATMLAVLGTDGWLAVWTDVGPAFVDAGTNEGVSTSASVAWSPDGQRLAVGYNDGSLRSLAVDRTGSGAVVFRATGSDVVESGVVQAVAYTDDGRAVRVVTGKGTVETLAVRTVVARSPFSGTPSALVLARSDGGQLALADGSKVHVLGGAGTGGTVIPVPVGVSSLAWSADGGDLAIVDRGGHLVRVDPTSGAVTEPIALLDVAGDGDNAVVSAWTPSGELVALVDGEGTVHVFDREGRDRPVGTGLASLVALAVTWAPDGNRLLVSDGSLVHVADLDGTSAPVVGNGASAVWSPDGVTAALHDGAQTVDLVELSPTRLSAVRARPRRLRLPQFVTTMAWNESGTVLAVLDSGGRVRFVDRATWDVVGAPVDLVGAEAGDLRWIGDDQLLVAGAGGRVTVLRSWTAADACDYLQQVVPPEALRDATSGTDTRHACERGAATGASLPMFTDVPQA